MVELKTKVVFNAGSFKGNQHIEVNETVSFTTDTTNKTGLSKRTIEQEVQIARDIIPEVQEFIKEQEIGKKEALLIAREEPQIQEKIIYVIYRWSNE